ncbi:MAG: response regulator [Ruminococcus sp.]|nr:response regulator [Ruminococcus sp.]
MLNIVVCDDEPVIIDIVTDEINDVMRRIGVEHRLYGYRSADEMIGELQSAGTEPDIIFLDIRMPVFDGKQAAVILSQLYPRCRIVFLTAYEEEIYDAFDYDVSSFLSKYQMKEKLPSILVRLVRRITGSCGREITLNVLFSEKTGERLITVNENDILYFERARQKNCVYLRTKGKYPLDMPWNEIITRFDEPPFASPNGGSLVNINRISLMDMNAVYIDGIDTGLEISRDFREEFLKRYIDLVTEQETAGQI